MSAPPALASGPPPQSTVPTKSPVTMAPPSGVTAIFVASTFPNRLLHTWVPSAVNETTNRSRDPTAASGPPPKSTAPSYCNSPARSTPPPGDTAIALPHSWPALPKRLLHTWLPSAASLTTNTSSSPALVRGPPPKSAAPMKAPVTTAPPSAVTAIAGAPSVLGPPNRLLHTWLPSEASVTTNTSVDPALTSGPPPKSKVSVKVPTTTAPPSIVAEMPLAASEFVLPNCLLHMWLPSKASLTTKISWYDSMLVRGPPPKSTVPRKPPAISTPPSDASEIAEAEMLAPSPNRSLHTWLPSAASLATNMSDAPVLVRAPPPKSIVPSKEPV